MRIPALGRAFAEGFAPRSFEEHRRPGCVVARLSRLALEHEHQHRAAQALVAHGVDQAVERPRRRQEPGEDLRSEARRLARARLVLFYATTAREKAVERIVQPRDGGPEPHLVKKPDSRPPRLGRRERRREKGPVNGRGMEAQRRTGNHAEDALASNHERHEIASPRTTLETADFARAVDDLEARHHVLDLAVETRALPCPAPRDPASDRRAEDRRRKVADRAAASLEPLLERDPHRAAFDFERVFVRREPTPGLHPFEIHHHGARIGEDASADARARPERDDGNALVRTGAHDRRDLFGRTWPHDAGGARRRQAPVADAEVVARPEIASVGEAIVGRVAAQNIGHAITQQVPRGLALVAPFARAARRAHAESVPRARGGVTRSWYRRPMRAPVLVTLALAAFSLVSSVTACGGPPAPQTAQPAGALPGSGSAGSQPGPEGGSTTGPTGAARGPRKASCEGGTCTVCGEGICPTGFYCEIAAKGRAPACAWSPACADKPTCACLTKAAPGCTCDDRNGAPSLTCN
jgi:hypothetical protein